MTDSGARNDELQRQIESLQREVADLRTQQLGTLKEQKAARLLRKKASDVDLANKIVALIRSGVYRDVHIMRELGCTRYALKRALGTLPLKRRVALDRLRYHWPGTCVGNSGRQLRDDYDYKAHCAEVIAKGANADWLPLDLPPE